MDLDPALRLCRRESVRFDLVFLDPPYERQDLYSRDLACLGSELVLARHAWVVAEHPRRLAMPEAAGVLRRSRTREQGTSAVSFYEAEGS
jgi:16S rRNA G966 N2-methylase RsmD